MESYVDVIYFNGLYNRNSTIRTSDSLVFEDGTVRFHAGGHGYEIATEYIRGIVPVQED